MSPGAQGRLSCNRCGAPVEPPVTFADEICGPYADLVISGVCGHVPLCASCVDCHVAEVIEDIEEMRGQPGVDVPMTQIEMTRKPGRDADGHP